jgi:hypothetical protein
MIALVGVYLMWIEVGRRASRLFNVGIKLNIDKKNYSFPVKMLPCLVTLRDEHR